MVTPEVLSEIRNAVEDPALYSAGAEKHRLRVAFDALTSQVCTALFEKEPDSRLDARQSLNAYKRKKGEASEWKLVQILRESIRESETSLHAKGYADHVEDIQSFIKQHLEPLYAALI
jgi:hypothetical protein